MAADDADAVLVIEAGRANWDPLLGRIAGEIVLGEIGPVVGGALVVIYNDNLAVEGTASQHLGRRGSGGTRSDDYDFTQRRLWGPFGIGRRQWVALDLVAHDDGAAATLDTPTGDRV